MYVCLGKHRDLEKYRGMSGMYACPGKHTYVDKKGYVCMYVCMHGPNGRTSKARVCMFLGDIEESDLPSLYVCPGKHTYLEN